MQSVADRRHRRGPAGYNSCGSFGIDYFDDVNRCWHDGVWLSIGYCGLFSAGSVLIQIQRNGATLEVASGFCIGAP